MAGSIAGGLRRALAVFAAAVGTIAVLAAPAGALPPVIETAGATNGLVTSSWSLPSGVRAEFFEVAKYPDVNVYGYFRQKLVRPGEPEDGAESQVRFGVLYADQTSLTPDDPSPPLPAGRYYVHIAGHDRVYDGCPLIEFSDIWEVTIKGDGTVESRLYLPGTGNCTLRKPGPGGGGGGGGGSGGGGGGAFTDKTLPIAQLRASKKQDVDKLYVRARMSEPGTLRATALVDVGGLLARVYTFRAVSRSVTGGVLTKLPLKLAKTKKRAVKRALRRGKRLRVRVVLTARDRAGNTTTKHATIRLRP